MVGMSRTHPWRGARSCRHAAVVMGCLLVAAGARGASSRSPDAGRAEADSTLGTTLPSEILEALEDLEAADQPLAERELRAAAGAPDRARTDFDVRWRASATGSGPRQDGRFDLRGKRLAARAAIRLRPGRAADLTGGFRAGIGTGRVWIGHLTMRHGFGLVAADPARRTSLGADRALGGVSGGLSVRTAALPVAAAPQGGVEAGFGSWNLAGHWGPDPAGTNAVRVARDGTSGAWALLAQRDTSAYAFSWSGRQSRADLEITWEMAARRPAAPTPGIGAATGWAGVTGLAWRPASAFRLEAQSGIAGAAWPEAVAILPTGARSGWALRALWRDRGRGVLQVLVQGARQTPRSSAPRRSALQVAELAWERQTGAGLTFALRARHAARRETTWPERTPWEPGDESAGTMRTLLAADMDWEAEGLRLGGRWRSFTSAGSTGGTRQAFSLAGRRAFGKNLNLWAQLTAAWGDPVDLVTALSPTPGLVVARHWGRWQSETACGAAFGWGPLAVRAALARRLPEPLDDEASGVLRPSLEGWLEVSGSW